MPDPSPSTLTVLNSNFLQLGRRCGGRPQRTVYPHAVTCQHCDTHNFSRPRTHNLPIVSPTRYSSATDTPCIQRAYDVPFADVSLLSKS